MMVSGTSAVIVYSGKTLDFVGYAANGNAVQTPATIALSSYPSPALSHVLGPLLHFENKTLNQQLKFCCSWQRVPQGAVRSDVLARAA
jgi:hypothetical protein